MKFGSAKIRGILTNVALMTVSLGIAILGTDIGLRFFGEKLFYYRPHEMFFETWPEMPLVWRYRKNAEYAGETYGDLAAMSGDRSLREERYEVFKTDPFGFRNDKKLSGSETYDVIVLGDSFGTGNGTTQDKTWASLLQSRYGLQTYNLSIPGSPWQSYVNLAAEIKRLPTHTNSIILLTIFSGNDLDDYYYDTNVDFAGLPWTTTFENLSVRLDTFVRKDPIRQLMRRLQYGGAPDQILERSYGGRKILFFQPHVAIKDRTEQMVEDHPNYSKLLDVIRKIDKIADEHDSSLLILLAPSKEEVYEWLLNGSSPWTTSMKASGFATALSNFCRQNGLPFFDLKPSLVEASHKVSKESGKLLWWRDDTHWNETGHEIVVDSVYKFISKPSSYTADKGM